jgi:hypothetical protein
MLIINIDLSVWFDLQAGGIDLALLHCRSSQYMVNDCCRRPRDNRAQISQISPSGRKHCGWQIALRDHICMLGTAV